jgi:hypothetical protein
MQMFMFLRTPNFIYALLRGEGRGKESCLFKLINYL